MAPAAFDDFKHAIVGQESSGQYGVANTQGSGALGLGQIMPATAKALSARLNLPYSPALLSGTDPAAQQYQNTLTDAATRDAWNAGHGDPRAAAEYYFAGPNPALHGPKTRAYANSILSRLAG